ncbi:hypothetical protein GIB67_040519 [Kingdonia uniflora]|uniref:Exostosin GT47 domain-containing protein n=1 Tax=Kingdonia uniflora TaxID=39325 RepID=A0A7J7L595_9MAGN|nr:hypothetical protein GIB67_040519 [Kingdonia uniflora]
MQQKSSNGRKQFWFAILIILLLSLILLHFNSSALIRRRDIIQSSVSNSLYFVNTRIDIEDGVEPVNRLSVNDTRVEPEILTLGKNTSEPVVPFPSIENGMKHVEENVIEPVSPIPVIKSPVTDNGVEMEHVDDLVVIKGDLKDVKANGVQSVNETSILKNKEEHVDKVVVAEKRRQVVSDPCSGKYVYVHIIPRRFNADIIRECRAINVWTDMCYYLANAGLGPTLENSQGVFHSKGWFATDQFALEVIFNNRMKQYKCLTTNSSMASAIFIPFFAGLDVSRYLWFNTSMKNNGAFALVKWLRSRREWKVMGGRDHFLVAGRIAWDFRRLTTKESDWGNNLLALPETRNMTTLVIESSPWHSNDFAIPYPTYFHPSCDQDVFQWQDRMRRQRKHNLFSFAGAPRPNLKGSIRNQIIEQCIASKSKCRFLACTEKRNKCLDPSNLMKMFQNSVFCLQPPGDSYTRRSAFDSILAGCIPVFFHPGSAYVQYGWHLPQDYKKYSVLIPEDKIRDGTISIETELQKIPREEVRAMRETVISLIPKLIYADPRSKLETLEDAFDIAVKGVIERVDGIRAQMRRGENPEIDVDTQENYWKYSLFGTVGEHEWDHFFFRTWNITSP